MPVNIVKMSQFRFLLVGAIAAGLYFFLVVIFVNLSLGGPAAAFISYFIVFLFGYAGHKKFSFRSKSSHAITAPRYAILQSVCAIFAAISAAITEYIGITEPLAIAVITTAVLGLVSYHVSSKWVFPQ